MRRWLLIIFLAFLFLTTGCDRARSKFDQVHLGMTRAEAVAILGEPQERKTGVQGESLLWRFEDQEVLLVFNHDKVIGKQVTGNQPKGTSGESHAKKN